MDCKLMRMMNEESKRQSLYLHKIGVRSAYTPPSPDPACDITLGEDVDHILLHCKLITRLWWDIFRWFGVSWAMPRSVKEMMFSWKGGARRRRHKAWNVTPLALMWVIWKERNRRAFEGVETSFAQLRSNL